MASTLDALRVHTSQQDGPAVLDAIRRAPDAAIDQLTERLLASPSVPLAPVVEKPERPRYGGATILAIVTHDLHTPAA